jgi:hypothetical protein
MGAFLLFCVPIGGGIPAGVLMARNAGVSPPAMATLYFLSDIVLAFTFEPILLVATWLGRWCPRSRGWRTGSARWLAVQVAHRREHADLSA